MTLSRRLPIFVWCLLSGLTVAAAPASATDLLWSPVSVNAGPVDSAGILRAELEARGRIVVRCDSLDGFVLADYDSVWVCLGVFPFTHPLTFDEGRTLHNYLLSGGKLMIEGGDIWGYDVLTPLNNIDGIAASADGGSTLAGIQGVRTEFGMDFSELSSAYQGENTRLDRLHADEPGAGVIFSEWTGAYDLGIFHDGSRSGLGDFLLIGNSFEFGGWRDDRAALLDRMLVALELEADCTHLGPTPPTCELITAGAQLRWSNLSIYATLDVVRDGVVIASLPPTVTSYIDLAPPAGRHEYRIAASDGRDCSWLSGACSLDLPDPEQFRRGDANNSGALDISDAIRLLQALFVPNSLLECPDAGDVNDSGSIDISDAILLLRHVFEGTQDPPHPHGLCGSDPTEDSLAPCAGVCQ